MNFYFYLPYTKPDMYKRVFKYINHFLTARKKNGRGIKSPQIKNLVTELIYDYTPYYCFKEIEQQRNVLLNDHETIEITDFGAGSMIHKGNTRQISSIAKHSLKPAKQAQLLFRLVNYFNCENILELGTSLGITTSYLAKVNSKSNVISLEGCPENLKIAKTVFNTLGIKNIKTYTGNFDETLPRALKDFSQLDFVFFDGNHQHKATLNYYLQCLPLAKPNSLFIFDDIHLNPEMEQFWDQLIKRKEIIVSLDLFHLGIVFFNTDLSKTSLKLRF